MEKKQYKLCMEVLRRFDKEGILKNLILIGSWSIYFYKAYFDSKTYPTFIKTRDMDFLVPIPAKFSKKVDIFEIVKDLGFLEVFRGSKGYIRLEHPDLFVEFLVPERGRGSDKPYTISKLGINAQPLRYLDFLVKNTITVNFEGLRIKVPHPAAYALHKFIIFKRRKKAEKHDRDIEGALRVFRELMNSNQKKAVKRIFDKMNKKWQRTVLKNLESVKETEVIDILKQK